MSEQHGETCGRVERADRMQFVPPTIKPGEEYWRRFVSPAGPRPPRYLLRDLLWLTLLIATLLGWWADHNEMERRNRLEEWRTRWVSNVLEDVGFEVHWDFYDDRKPWLSSTDWRRASNRVNPRFVWNTDLVPYWDDLFTTDESQLTGDVEER